MEFKEKKMYIYLLILSLGSVISFQAWRTLFNNFSVEVANLDSFGIGLAQSVREVPGFLAFIIIYILLIIKEHRLAALGNLLMGVGVFVTGFFPSLWGIVFTTLVMSVGFHLFQVTSTSLILQSFSKKQSPFVFAKIKSLSALASVLTGGALFCLTAYLPYNAIYMISGGIVIATSIWSFTFNPREGKVFTQTKKMIFRKEYTLFYFLTGFSGARRQIFMVFAVFLMVKKFEFSISTIALLFALNNIINYFWLPQVAKIIDKFGERKLLISEYIGMILLFAAYAFTDSSYVVIALYIIDHMLFNFSIGINTYFQKIARPKDIAPTTSVSFTINHIAAVVVPLLGGILWQFNYKIPFFLGILFCLGSLICAFKLPSKSELSYDDE